MTDRTDVNLTGKGSPESDLTASDFRLIISEALSKIAADSRALAIISDKTRDDNTDALFPIAAEILADKKIAILDALVAQGTHSPMTEAEKLLKIGTKSFSDGPNLGNIFDHDWSNPEQLVTIGELSAEKVLEVTNNLFDKPIPLTINRLLAPGNYDVVLIFGATVPHEVAGFAGGAKYFFPGVAGAELTHATHWLAALATIENIIGRIETPTRHLIETAADFVPLKYFVHFVVARKMKTAANARLVAGDLARFAPRRRSFAVSSTIYGEKYKRVVASRRAVQDYGSAGKKQLPSRA